MPRGALIASTFLLLAGCGDATRLEVVEDHCAGDEQKVYPGVCGCGVPEDRCVPLKDALVHRYAFDGVGSVAVDDVGGADGVLVNTVLMNVGQAYLDRGAEQEQYVALPNGIVSALTSATFEAWVVWETPPLTPPPFWERIFDFGVSTAGEDQREQGKSYIFLAPGQPATTPPKARTAYRDLTSDGEILVDAPEAFPNDVVFNVAVVVNSANQKLILYLNAVEQARTTLAEPLSAIEDVNNWLGRSQFSKDSRFGGSFLEFRIYDRALTPDELAQSLAFGDSPAFLRPAKLTSQDASGAP